MTVQTTPTPPPVARHKLLRWALVASLAVNLTVGGLALGAYLHGPPPGHGGFRDLGFGPYDAALRPADREALRGAMRAKAGDLAALHGEMAADNAAILSALRAMPFDPAQLNTALDSQQKHLGARMKLGSDTIGDYLASLSPQDRADFADRLEQRLLRGRDAVPSEPAK
jgi:uncharacterized membrane protein